MIVSNPILLKIETKKTIFKGLVLFFHVQVFFLVPLLVLVSVGRLDFCVLVGQPVGQVEDDEDRRGDPHGPQVDVVARLLDLARHTLLEIHLGQGGLCGVRVSGEGCGGWEEEKKRTK